MKVDYYDREDMEAMDEYEEWEEGDEDHASEEFLESAPFNYAARSRRTASLNFLGSVRASSQVLDT